MATHARERDLWIERSKESSALVELTAYGTDAGDELPDARESSSTSEARWTMAKLRVAVLYDVWDDGRRRESPPPRAGQQEAREGRPPGDPRGAQGERALADLLRDRRHARIAQGAADTECDLVFNLTESWAGDDTKDINLAAYLDLLHKKYTGAGPGGLHLAQNKSLAKKIFAFHGIRTPYFASVHRGRPRLVARPAVPGDRQAAREDGSIGISFNALCESIKDLMERIHELHEQFDSPS
jgi:D-alanine-D-alanine ligase